MNNLDKINRKHKFDVTTKTRKVSGYWGQVQEYRCKRCLGDYGITPGFEEHDNGLCEGCDLDERGMLW